jgi:hypothetical protein
MIVRVASVQVAAVPLAVLAELYRGKLDRQGVPSTKSPMTAEVYATRVCLTAHEGSHIINEAMTTIAW